jgi:hypothetical protein
LFLKALIPCRLIVVLDQRVIVYALETLEKLSTLETAANPKVWHPRGIRTDILSNFLPVSTEGIRVIDAPHEQLFDAVCLWYCRASVL